jgi:hypothetical protein
VIGPLIGPAIGVVTVAAMPRSTSGGQPAFTTAP